MNFTFTERRVKFLKLYTSVCALCSVGQEYGPLINNRRMKTKGLKLSF